MFISAQKQYAIESLRYGISDIGCRGRGSEGGDVGRLIEPVTAPQVVAVLQPINLVGNRAPFDHRITCSCASERKYDWGHVGDGQRAINADKVVVVIKPSHNSDSIIARRTAYRGFRFGGWFLFERILIITGDETSVG